jgi:hypothetical protein
MERRRPEQIRFPFDDSGTDIDVWTITEHGRGCIIQVMLNEGEVPPDGRRLTLPRAHTEASRKQSASRICG